MPDGTDGTPLEQGSEEGHPPVENPKADDAKGDNDLDPKAQEIIRRERDAARAATKAQREAAAQLKELQARLTEFEQRDLTEQQKLERRTADLEQQLAEAQKTLTDRELSATRYRVATVKGLPADLVDRLIGATEEEISEDADRLLALVASTRRTPDFDPGVRTPPPSEPDMNSLIRRGFGLV